MKCNPLHLLYCVLLSLPTYLQAQTHPNTYVLDLNHIEKDELGVLLNVAPVKGDTLTYYFPSVVPGTYCVSDFGRFVKAFEAFNQEGDPLLVLHPDVNTWEVVQGDDVLGSIKYTIEDTWDATLDNFIFEPSGTSFEEDKCFVLNPFGCFGYFEGQEAEKVAVEITHPKYFYGATSLKKLKSENHTDYFLASSYHELADAPIMYSVPDTTLIQVGKTEVMIAVYGGINNPLNSKWIANEIEPILKVQQQYLGGTLPVDHYTFIWYFDESPSSKGYLGALEHNYASFYYLPRVESKGLKDLVKDIAAHEFFHIITPLSIHSEEIHSFDYQNPKMSQHLWLYEGATEYAAHLVQVKYGLISKNIFVNRIREKLFNAASYREDVSFTEMSQLCLHEHQNEYGNVYEKGALIAMCLDLWLLNYSSGEKDLQWLLSKLSEKYGKDKPFKDEELIDDIVAISNMPNLRGFFERYVYGVEPLPLEEALLWVGYSYDAYRKTEEMSWGNVIFSVDGRNNLIVSNTEKMDDVGHKMGYKEGDIIKYINGEQVDTSAAVIQLYTIFDDLEEGDQLVVEIERFNKRGIRKRKKLQAKVKKKEKIDLHLIETVPVLTDYQQLIRQKWLSTGAF